MSIRSTGKKKAEQTPELREYIRDIKKGDEFSSIKCEGGGSYWASPHKIKVISRKGNMIEIHIPAHEGYTGKYEASNVVLSLEKVVGYTK